MSSPGRPRQLRLDTLWGGPTAVISDSTVEETAQAEKLCLSAARQEVAERKVVENWDALGKEFVKNGSRDRYGNLSSSSTLFWPAAQ